ncbi:hypothetical protein HZI73_06180 [Vallitalea pronyensis]|uniref:Uncharacterized protein n=1 Tax=Vallitalea pronyensis TaxID=1348613 RepID=A0A8J8MHT9_9FIRM|nr:hypothetical protein [Vallitalea pronyensis]QUI21915.1 hypothetical protein HZI73_06180 [Vallitalea pronyensis]
MNCKKLPITKPPIIGYVVHAFPLSIIFNYDKCLPWFYNNYMQLVCHKGLQNNFFDFFSLCMPIEDIQWVNSVYPGIPWLNTHTMDNYLLIDCNIDIKQAIIHALKRENYMVCHLDEFYVPNRISFQKEHYFHENMIFGFDHHKKAFDILGFDHKGIFRSSTISYDLFDQASSQLASNNHDLKFLHLKDDFIYALDLTCIKNGLRDYLNGENSSQQYTIIRNPTHNYVYGMDIYNQLILYLKRLYNLAAVSDIRPFHLLWEHKKCMVLRIAYILAEYNETITDLEEIHNTYLTIQQTSQSIRNLFLKYNLTRRGDIIERIIPLLQDMCMKEKTILPKFISVIEGLEKRGNPK